MNYKQYRIKIETTQLIFVTRRKIFKCIDLILPFDNHHYKQQFFVQLASFVSMDNRTDNAMTESNAFT